MRLERALASLLVVVPLLAVPVLAGPGSGVAPDGSSIHTYEDLVAEVAALQAAGAVVEVPAQSREGRDIFLVRIGTGPYHILLTNVLHANEPAGTEAFLRFAWALLGDMQPSFEQAVAPTLDQTDPIFDVFTDAAVRQAVLSRVTILGFPMMDPDGVANGHQRDPLANTDYATQLTPQSEAITYVIDTYHPELMLDSHGGVDTHELNVGVVETQYTEAAVIHLQRRATQTMWSAAEQVGLDVGYFEEHFGQVLFEEEPEPVLSLGEVYWDAAARYGIFTQASWQLRGVPSMYTETVGLQSMKPMLTISEGGSVQEVTMLAVALHGAGLLDATSPARSVTTIPAADPGTTASVVVAHDGGTVFASIDWPYAVVSDARIELWQGGELMAASGPPALQGIGQVFEQVRWSRSVLVDDLPAGEATVKITALGLPLERRLKVLVRSPDEQVTPLTGILHPTAQAQFGEAEPGLYRQLDPVPRTVEP